MSDEGFMILVVLALLFVGFVTGTKYSDSSIQQACLISQEFNVDEVGFKCELKRNERKQGEAK